nr:stability determinant [uncultured Halomonas sp.]
MSTPLDPIVSEFETQEQADSYDRWFRERIQRSLDDTRPNIPHDEAMARVRAVIEAKKLRHVTD